MIGQTVSNVRIPWKLGEGVTTLTTKPDPIVCRKDTLVPRVRSLNTSFRQYILGGLVFAVQLLFSSAAAQMTELRVPSSDSVLSRFAHCGFLAGTVFVEGTIVPLPGATVTLSEQPLDVDADSGGFLERSRADNKGTFSCNLVPEGLYYLEADYPGYFPYSESVWINHWECSTVVMELVPDYSHSSMHTTGSVQFEVTDESTGEVIDGANIHLKESHEIIDTDTWGTRFVHHFRPWRYHFFVTADGFHHSAEDSVNVVAGTCTFLAVHLREVNVSRSDRSCHENHHKPYPVSTIDPASFGKIVGIVVDEATDAPLGDAYVYLAPYDMDTISDSTGTFTFRGLRPGIYCATARVPGFYRTTEHEIQLLPGRTVKVDIELREAPVSEEQ